MCPTSFTDAAISISAPISACHAKDRACFNLTSKEGGSCCNYCREEWAEYWISYGHICSSFISRRQQESAAESDEINHGQPNSEQAKHIL